MKLSGFLIKKKGPALTSVCKMLDFFKYFYFFIFIRDLVRLSLGWVLSPLCNEIEKGEAVLWYFTVAENQVIEGLSYCNFISYLVEHLKLLEIEISNLWK